MQSLEERCPIIHFPQQDEQMSQYTSSGVYHKSAQWFGATKARQPHDGAGCG